MILYILNKTYDTVGLIDQAESILWNKKYNDIGECEIYIPCSEEYMKLLKIGYYVYRFDDDMCCRITSVKLETNIENGDYLIITAKDICSIISSRCVWKEINFEGRVCDFIKQLLDENIINPTMEKRGINVRKIDNFVFDNSNFSDFTETFNYQTKYEDILQLIILICKQFNYGFRLSFDLENKQFIFRIYKGLNRSEETSETYVEFSPEFSNIISTVYEKNNENYKNSAMVVGKYINDEIVTEVVGTVDNGVIGLDRNEIFVDATNISPKYKDEFDIEHEYTISEYRQLLIDKGNEVLSSRKIETSFSGEVYTIDTYEYKVDYNIGDIVKVKNEYGIEANARITEVMESEDSNEGYVAQPTFEYIN